MRTTHDSIPLEPLVQNGNAVRQPGVTAHGCAPRVLQNHTIDSTRWNDFEFRDNDIVIATWAKSGTTWLQQIIGQLIFGHRTQLPVYDICMWVEQRLFPLARMQQILRVQPHRRFLKTHLPVDALVFDAKAKYIYVGRDGRDTVRSLFNHHTNLTPSVYRTVNATPGLVGPPFEPPGHDNLRDYFLEWLQRDGFPLWPFWGHVQSWWDIRHRDNVHLVHFNRLKSDFRGELHRLAAFLEIDLAAPDFAAVTEHCTFEYMKANAAKLSRFWSGAFKGGGQTFLDGGVNGRWKDLLTPLDIAGYHEAAAQHLTPECAHWLETGSDA